jgi:hypothetical protein
MRDLLLIFFGVLIGLIPPWFARKRRLKTHWCALRAEMEQCRDKAETLLRDNVMAPLYRLPIACYQISFPILLSDGALDEQDALTLGRFFSQVQDINRGLDNAAEMYKRDDIEKVRVEYQRNCLKANALFQNEGDRPAFYPPAKKIVDEKILLPWYKHSKIA